MIKSQNWKCQKKKRFDDFEGKVKMKDHEIDKNQKNIYNSYFMKYILR